MELNPVGKTSQWVAGLRSMESAKPEGQRRLFDPFAEKFTTEETIKHFDAIEKILPTATAHFVDCIVQRHLTFDAVVTQYANIIPQVVIAGCGGDSRSRRLSVPRECTFFELDQSEVLAFRERVFPAADPQNGPRIRPVAVDFRQSDWTQQLLTAGFRADLPSVWIMEGLLPYLSPSQQAFFISQVTTLCPSGSVMAGDYNAGLPQLQALTKHFPQLRALMEHFQPRELKVSGLDYPENLFILLGWPQVSCTEMEGAMLASEQLLQLYRQMPRSPPPAITDAHRELFAGYLSHLKDPGPDTFLVKETLPHALQEVLWAPKLPPELAERVFEEGKPEDVAVNDPTLISNTLPRWTFFTAFRQEKPPQEAAESAVPGSGGGR
ncbi:putative SAM-dependent methyltransferase [Paratrimastix pyriformis]|uniref:SAM-dependent methyltransferase n=1 Tax=Paratrimastix pyriformis TaxID=342808 RepID=A0ABQ8UD97_9EUKA|nr:putative SAM-dependent methyltransferase [Paratrimastix pyriformis]